MGGGQAGLFGPIVLMISAVIAIFLIPTYFVLLGIGLGNVSSISALNKDLSEAVAEVGENTAFWRDSGTPIEGGAEAAAGPSADQKLDLTDDE